MPSVRLELTTFRLWDWRANQLRQEGLKFIMTQIAFNFHSKIMTRVHRTANRRVRCKQCEGRTVWTSETVRTTNSANILFFRNRRTGRTVRTGANTVRWSLIMTVRIIQFIVVYIPILYILYSTYMNPICIVNNDCFGFCLHVATYIYAIL